MEEDIYQHLKELEQQHVRAVRGLEKLAKALEHVHEARTELSDLSEDGNLGSTAPCSEVGPLRIRNR